MTSLRIVLKRISGPDVHQSLVMIMLSSLALNYQYSSMSSRQIPLNINTGVLLRFEFAEIGCIVTLGEIRQIFAHRRLAFISTEVISKFWWSCAKSQCLGLSFQISRQNIERVCVRLLGHCITSSQHEIGPGFKAASLSIRGYISIGGYMS